ncbi:MAG: hypothetical protein LBK73_07025 [Treponema sp.]|nr:hypothetical protein [Treponema sp.]
MPSTKTILIPQFAPPGEERLRRRLDAGRIEITLFFMSRIFAASASKVVSRRAVATGARVVSFRAAAFPGRTPSGF